MSSSETVREGPRAAPDVQRMDAPDGSGGPRWSSPTSDPVPAVSAVEDRLVPIALIASGGQGSVHAYFDTRLHRRVALKVVHNELAHGDTLQLFVEEAQVTAQLAHPSIPAVHEIGRLADGRPFFTMAEVRGRTLHSLLQEYVDAGRPRAVRSRLLDVFQRVCEAVSYAHARGVVHCDLKPSNVMIGPFGEVMVMDWGVAHFSPHANPDDISELPVETSFGRHSPPRGVAGTFGYMAREQLLGGEITPATDVYALGSILFELLTGEPAFVGGDAAQMAAAIQGLVPDRPAGGDIDDDVWSIVQRTLQAQPERRFNDAGLLAQQFARWRDGALRRERALRLVGSAEALFEKADETRRQAGEFVSSARRVGETAGAWALEDRGEDRRRAADRLMNEAVAALHKALEHDPDNARAKAHLARVYHERHRDAVSRRAWDEASEHEVLLRANDRGRFAAYLNGLGRLQLETTVPCRARVRRFSVQARRLHPGPVDDLGTTPLLDVTLPAGSYVVELLADGRAPVTYPIVLRPDEDWNRTAPGDATARPIFIPEARDVGEHCFVPAGWFECSLAEGTAGRAWVEDFVIQRTPVTALDLATFLASDEGRPFRGAALRDGLDVWQRDWPATGVSWPAAQAYARWFAAQEGEPWRLPSELEWEKAARGVDGRRFPWGDFAHGAFAWTQSSEPTPHWPCAVRAQTLDVSPYGLVGAAGNVREWCEGTLADAVAVVRGGSWRLDVGAAGVAARAVLPLDRGHPDVGLRLVRSLGPAVPATGRP